VAREIEAWMNMPIFHEPWRGRRRYNVSEFLGMRLGPKLRQLYYRAKTGRITSGT
jgi:hypothetical protein